MPRCPEARQPRFFSDQMAFVSVQLGGGEDPHLFVPLQRKLVYISGVFAHLS